MTSFIAGLLDFIALIGGLTLVYAGGFAIFILIVVIMHRLDQWRDGNPNRAQCLILQTVDITEVLLSSFIMGMFNLIALVVKLSVTVVDGVGRFLEDVARHHPSRPVRYLAWAALWIFVMAIVLLIYRAPDE
jgi:hypothetical protein